MSIGLAIISMTGCKPKGRYVIFQFSGGSEIAEFHTRDVYYLDNGGIKFKSGDSTIMLPSGSECQIIFIPQ